MKTFNLKKKLLIALPLLALIFFGSSALTYTHNVNADSLFNKQLVSPASQAEYYALSSPIDAYVDDSVTAVVQGGTTQSLLLYNEQNGFNEVSGIALKQVKRLDVNSLVYSDNAKIYKVDLTTGQKSDYNDVNGTILTANFFDLNANFFTTSFSSKVLVYSLSNGLVGQEYKYSQFTTAEAETPVAINANDEVFYIVNESSTYKIRKHCLADDSMLNLVSTSSAPTSMIANEHYVYYIVSNELHRVSISSGTDVILTTGENNRFDLGNLNASTSPANVSFKGDNILATFSSGNSVQEFQIQGNTPVFTGFAIAKGKTAFNRIASSVKQIERYGDNIMVVDNNKITVANVGNNFNFYDSALYSNYFLTDLENPSKAALGKSEILLGYATNELKYLNKQGSFALTGSLKDITYQSGYFYAVTDDGLASRVFKAKEGSLEFTQTLLLNSIHAEELTVDVFGNCYVYDSNNIYLNDSATPYCAGNGLDSFTTDLCGNLFAIKDSSFLYYNTQSGAWVEIFTETSDIAAFAMNFDKKEVYYVFSGEEYVYKTISLDNAAINSIIVPTEYVLSGNNADFSQFKLYTVDNANVYSVTADREFTFNGLNQIENEYVYVCSAFVDTVNGSHEYYALASKAGISLVNATDATQKTVQYVSCDYNAFIATGVNVYYIPILTKTNDYVLSANNQTIRAGSKGLEFTPTAKFTCLDLDFYFATIEIDGVSYTGYIPVSFTVEILSADYIAHSFTVEKVKDTDIFADEALTVKLACLTKGQEVKVVEIKNGVAQIYYQTQSGYVTAYMNARYIDDAPGTAVRNVLIVLAVITCICGSVTYFLLRKKS